MEVKELCCFVLFFCFMAFLYWSWFLGGPILSLLASSFVSRFAIRRPAGVNI
jgi:hypothetical protein